MSKESILNKHWVNHNKKTSDPEFKLALSIEEIDMIEDVMDEYAQQMAIGFTEWCDDNYISHKNGEKVLWTKILDMQDVEEREKFTTEQLYQLYIESLNK